MKRVLLSTCVLASVVVLSACGKKETVTPTDTADSNVEAVTPKAEDLVVQQGDTVAVRYIWALENGEVFDTNIIEEAQKAWTFNELRPYDALAFTIGQGNMIPGFERGVIGMKIWETKTLNIPAVDGYGAVRDDMIQTIAVTEFEEAEIDWQAWEIGEKYTFGQIQGTVKTINEDAVTIDFNHFLAGKDLVFTATVEDITR